MAVFVVNSRASLEDDAGYFSALGKYLPGAPAVSDLNALFLRLLDLVRGGGHFFFALKAEHRDLASGRSRGASRNVDSHVSAADHDDVAGKAQAVVLIYAVEEFDAALNALGVLAGNARFASAHKADGDIEGLVAVPAERVYRNVAPDLYAAADLNAHLAENVDLRLDNVLFKPERGYAVCKHSARSFLLLEHGHVVAALAEIIGAGETGGSGSDDRHLVIRAPHSAVVLLADGDVSRLCLELLGGYELLYLVDSNRLIDGSPRAGVLAAAVADRAAYGGEGVVLLYELKGVEVSALRRHLNVALNGEVGGAGGLAGRRARVVAVYLRVLAVVHVPVIRRPLCRVGQLGEGILYLALPGAELLSELRRADGADLDALSAGDAFFLLNVGSVGAAGHIRGIVKLARSQGVADAGGAVAYRDDLLLAVDIRDLVNEAVALGALEYLHNLVVAYVAAHIAVDAVFRHIADADAEFAVYLAGALAAHCLLLAAGALADGVFIVFLEPVGDVLHARGLALALDSLLDRDNVHSDSGSSGGYHRGHVLKRHLGHKVEEGREIRVLSRQLVVHHHKLRRAGHEDGHVILLVLIRVLPVHLENAHPAQVVDHLLALLLGHIVHLREGRSVVGDAGLLEVQKELCLLLRQHLVERPVLRIVRLHCAGVFDEVPVRYHRAELKDKLLLLLIRRDIVRVLPEIPLVHHSVFLILHACLPLPLLFLRILSFPLK